MRVMRSFKNGYQFPVIGSRLKKLLTVNCQLQTVKLMYAIVYGVIIILLMSPVMASGELLRTGQSTCYDQEGDIISHEGTGQDGDYQAGKVWPAPRFQDNGDGTITDLLTDLMWLKNASCLGWLSWQAAMNAASELNSKSRDQEHCSGVDVFFEDWSLPTIQELETLVNSEEKDPYNYLNFYGFQGVQADSYWSSTTGPNPYSAWLLYFDSGEVLSEGKVETHHVLLVRKKDKTESSQPGSASSPGSTEIDDEGKRFHLIEHLSLLRDVIFHTESSQPDSASSPGSTEIDDEGKRFHLIEHLSLLRDVIFQNQKITSDSPKSAASKAVDEMSRSSLLDNGDGTVTDTETGLMWMKDMGCIGSMNWQSGLDAIHAFNATPLSFNCRGFTASSYQDWALPNRNELRSLISYYDDFPALIPDFPADEIKPYYWTSTTMAANPDSAYGVYMGNGELTYSPKEEKKYIWPVRPSQGRILRQRVPDKTETIELKADHYLLRPIGNRKRIEWPVKRFTDHGDGTIVDNLTGLMWLKDASCLERYSWEESFVIIRWLNDLSPKIKCEEYTVSYDNWQFPEMNQLEILLDGVQEEPAEWLNRQGTVNMQARDYWSSTENPLNLYHAWAMNMLAGGVRNYPKSFRLHVWPFRKQLVVGPVNPVLNVMINAEKDRVLLARSQELILSVSVHNNQGGIPADFRVWYDAPDGTVWWLTGSGHWHQEDKILYRGNIFNLDDYILFHAGTSNLEPGDYTFHFSITPILGSKAPSVVFSKDLVLNIEEAASTEDEIDEEVIILLE